MPDLVSLNPPPPFRQVRLLAPRLAAPITGPARRPRSLRLVRKPPDPVAALTWHINGRAPPRLGAWPGAFTLCIRSGCTCTSESSPPLTAPRAGVRPFGLAAHALLRVDRTTSWHLSPPAPVPAFRLGIPSCKWRANPSGYIGCLKFLSALFCFRPP